MVVLITGASSGVGRALARHYLRQGAMVAAVARRVHQLATLRDDAGHGMFVFPGDVTDRDAMAVIVAEIERTLGPIELAIACAGVAEEQSAPDLDLGSLQRTLATNVCGTFNILVPAVAAMRARGQGQVVAISSLAAEHSLPCMTAYCMSKSALDSGMQGLNLLLRGTGISVTTICPGFIATEMTAGRVPDRHCMSLDRSIEKIVSAIQRHRRVYRFPVWQYLLLCLLRLMPFAMQRIVLELVSNLLLSRQQVSVRAST